MSTAPGYTPWGAECPDGTPVPTAERCGDCDALELAALAVGERARVTCLVDPGGTATRRLAALGVLPGTQVLLVQRSPAIVFRMGHAELALDAALAAKVLVRRE
jgi:Fe2+ transport system protein FeoA